MRFLTLFILTFSLPALSLTLVKSTMTSIETESCLKVKNSDFDAPSVELPYEYYENECQGFGGYQVITGGKDLRYSVALKFKDSRVEFEGPTVLHSPAGGTVEWRYEHAENQAVEMKALIYKLHTIDEDTLVNADFFYVVRLNKEKSCLIGKITGSDEAALSTARKIADDTKAKCL